MNAAAPLLIDTAVLGQLLSTGRTRLFEMMRSGELGPTPAKVSTKGKLLFSRVEVELWTLYGCPPRREWKKMREKVIQQAAKQPMGRPTMGAAS